MAHGSGVQALDQEDAGLLHFGDEGGFFAVLHGHGHSQNDLVEITFQLALTGIQIQSDARGPLLTEDFRALGRFEGQVLHIDALQGELRVLRFLGALGFFGHG